MAKQKTLCIELTGIGASALMVMLNNEIESCHHYGGGIDLDNWENIDLEAYKLLAFHKFKTWYMENCSG